jgi:acyl-CoA thioester hydrolase
MINTEIQVRVRYGETDRMGFVYYGNYATYFEVARVEALRQMGISYREMEDGGISLPVAEYKIKYLKPAFYDDQLTLKTQIREMPRVRIIFHYETYNQDGVLLNIAETTLVFVDVKSGKPCLVPDFVKFKLQKFFPD